MKQLNLSGPTVERVTFVHILLQFLSVLAPRSVLLIQFQIYFLFIIPSSWLLLTQKRLLGVVVLLVTMDVR